MTATTYTVAFDGTEPRLVDVQCALSAGLPGFSIVGLPDKSVSEAKERIRAALAQLRIALPSKKVTVSLSPADLPKAGGHYDLPICLSILAALEVIPPAMVEGYLCVGELSLNGALSPVRGALPAAIEAASQKKALICPLDNGPEAAWVPAATVYAPGSLADLIAHLTGRAPLPLARALPPPPNDHGPCLSDIRGQESAKRALEIAAAGGHHLLMVGPPGAGKSMLAQRLPGVLPPLSPEHALDVAMLRSIAGELEGSGVSNRPPFRSPHHTASPASLIGGGRNATPGELSRAHRGVLFLDEVAELPRGVLDTLRQPLEEGVVTVARAARTQTYPCQVMLVAAANPCRCGHLADAGRACARAPICGQDYLNKLSGPLLDRIDLRIEVPPVSIQDLRGGSTGETSATVARRVAAARQVQEVRAGMVNARLTGADLDRFANFTPAAEQILTLASEKLSLTARGYYRLIRTARTIADLSQCETTDRHHIAEALSFRLAIEDMARY